MLLEKSRGLDIISVMPEREKPLSEQVWKPMVPMAVIVGMCILVPSLSCIGVPSLIVYGSILSGQRHLRRYWRH